jgi:hypothetical protein
MKRKSLFQLMQYRHVLSITIILNFFVLVFIDQYGLRGGWLHTVLTIQIWGLKDIVLLFLLLQLFLLISMSFYSRSSDEQHIYGLQKKHKNDAYPVLGDDGEFVENIMASSSIPHKGKNQHSI